METDAKGQLGGLDTSEAERKRYAEASGNWRCSVCGESNRGILAARAEAAKANEVAEGSKRVEEEVPKELTLKYKDRQEEKAHVPTPEEDEGAELAEGFVETAPLLPDPPTYYPPARPAQGLPQPTGSVSTGIGGGAARPEIIRNLQPPATTAAPQAQPMRERAADARRSSDGVPIWIDRAIAGVVICLIFMVLKMLLAS